ncbi:unnamed protein product [Linum tenue]|uniref:Uncharacterized protein n=1 Tax=Linum tenue TaxID=586396 RepID=A0AAV0QNT7_9ROSI|nr:unnamed protein product [Linum tenue]
MGDILVERSVAEGVA